MKLSRRMHEIAGRARNAVSRAPKHPAPHRFALDSLRYLGDELETLAIEVELLEQRRAKLRERHQLELVSTDGET